jgi:hypothetical protein
MESANSIPYGETSGNPTGGFLDKKAHSKGQIKFFYEFLQIALDSLNI